MRNCVWGEASFWGPGVLQIPLFLLIQKYHKLFSPLGTLLFKVVFCCLLRFYLHMKEWKGQMVEVPIMWFLVGQSIYTWNRWACDSHWIWHDFCKLCEDRVFLRFGFRWSGIWSTDDAVCVLLGTENNLPRLRIYVTLFGEWVALRCLHNCLSATTKCVCTLCNQKFELISL